MKRSLGVASLLLLLADPSLAQPNFLYVNNNTPGPNTVAAFSVAATGALSPLPGSPFVTGGFGTTFGFYASNRITTCVAGNYLFVANDGSDNVSVLVINPGTGALAPVPGSPFATGGSAGGFGISVAVTPDNKFLYAANGNSSNVTVFQVAANGALTPIPGSPFALPSNPDGTKLTPDGQFLVVTLPLVQSVAVLSLAANGTPSPVAGSPFPGSGVYPTGGPTGVDADCTNLFAFVAESNGFNTLVDVYSRLPGGALSPIPGSPFIFASGENSNVPLLGPDDKLLFVTNQFSNTVTVLGVAATGSLSLVAGSPFSNPGGDEPTLMATNQTGTLLYVSNSNGTVSVFQIAANGALSTAPGSPYITGPGERSGLVAFPPKSCITNHDPDCSHAVAAEPVLWPANHKYHAVAIQGVTDPDGDPVTIAVTGVTQDEPVNSRGDGNTCPDAQITDGQASVRAERTGTAGIPGNGRVYAITFTATDGKGGQCTGTVTVCVPHDQGDPTCVDDGQRYSSLERCSDGDGSAPETVSLTVDDVTGGEAQVTFALPNDTQVDVSAFDVTGRRLATIERGVLSKGVYERAWNLGGVANGVYFMRLRAGGVTLTKTVLKAR